MRLYFMQTERIGFSNWTKEDLPLANILWGEPDVTRYICAKGEFTKEEIANRLLLEIKNQETEGVQYWPIFEKSTRKLIGCCGARPFNKEPNCLEIGVHLRKQFWRRGFGSEAVKAVIQYCFNERKVDKLFAGHHPQNEGSSKLLTSLSFVYIGDNFYEPTGLYHPSYEMNRITIKEEDINSTDAICLLDELSDELNQITGNSGRASFDNSDCLKKRSIFLIARENGMCVGCGAFRKISQDTAEIKRVYAKRKSCGVGKRILKYLEQKAMEYNYTKVILETRTCNKKAVVFYINNGYTIIDNYGTYKHNQEAICFEKKLI